MGIKNFVKEYQDYFFIKRSLLERLDNTNLSPSNLELCFDQTNKILEEFKETLSFINTESKEVQIEIETALDSFNNKVDKINNYATALKTINSSERDVKSLVDLHPYTFSTKNSNWENQTKSYISTPLSSYKSTSAYTTIIEGNEATSKYLLDKKFATKYIYINKNINTVIKLVTCFDSDMSITNTIVVDISETNCLVKIDDKVKYISIKSNNIGVEELTLTQLSYKHETKTIINLEECTYKKGDLLTFKSNTDIPEGCYVQIHLKVLFKDVNDNIINSTNKWYSINNDGLVVLQYKDLTTESLVKVWKEGEFKNTKEGEVINEEDYVLCKEATNSLLISNTEDSFKLVCNRSDKVTIIPTLYLYTLHNRTETARISNLIGLTKNVI